MKRTDRRIVLWVILAISGALAGPGSADQLLPPPGDGDIRAVYWELRNESEVWLTLEPRSASGDAAPLLTFTCRFAGKRPAGAITEIDVRAYAGVFWAPRADLWFLLDDTHKLDLAPKGGRLISGTPSDYVSEMVSIDTVKRMVAEHRITGEALGFPFELRESQRGALRRFLDLALSGNPAQQPRR
ncbi:MAG TPA: hypothetical protein VJ813_09535 [Vicinamibacterales bacterium]|nr:hypothetical protein [Vicinamibacterales bacterium]